MGIFDRFKRKKEDSKVDKNKFLDKLPEAYVTFLIENPDGYEVVFNEHPDEDPDYKGRYWGKKNC